ncbi:PREDICTED: glycoprotein 3-alpha-L-fucosyltransferase A-like [Dinoponera quadriceps]|uniref:Fucosyltransferase n=1 Tax=Dinoponera quadriceps TaxID=609295 RepID=A0A6P3Y9P9_DINQU|nr:PREDICTED: glycoprotein 3-alpha-L-fucosyltransferase A-like [Dinoponera quadriceps]
MLMDESPMNCLSSSKETLDYDGLFNWTMTYRMNSDVPIPYGRTIRKASSLQSSLWEVNLMDSKTKLLAVMISHCGGRNQRMDYIKALKPLLRDHLDIIGGCISGNSTICPRHFHKDCSVLSSYKFYLSFENSDCREYMTEKVFWNAFHKHAVPIIMGAPLEDCRRLLPPGSYLHRIQALLSHLRGPEL